jgi:acyl dehydratase
VLLAPVDEVSVGDVIPARGRTITETDVVSFCYLTGNWLEIHSNAELAKGTRYGQRLVQGSLVFSIVPGLVHWDARYVVAMYGVDDLRLVRPVFIGDTISVRVTVEKVQEHDEETGIVTFANEVFNQRDEIVQTFRMQILGRRRREAARIRIPAQDS